MSMIIKKILIASTNPGKVAELSAMLDADVEWLSLADFEDISEIVEDGATFAENARKKALGYAKAAGLWTIADDSGLVVDALGAEPGVKSARFSETTSGPRHAATAPQVSGEKCADRKLLDHKNMVKVLELLKDVPREKRTARFICRLCLSSPQKVLIETEGIVEGIIVDSQIGTNGFGYDPIFFVPGLNKTVAQLSREEKNAISHRGNAIRNLKPLLNKLLKSAQHT